MNKENNVRDGNYVPFFRKGFTKCLQEKGVMEIHCAHDDEK